MLEEFYQVVTRRLPPGLPPAEAQQEVREFFAWQPLPVTTELVVSAWTVEEHYRLSFWDSLIVAGHLSGCRYLLTEDLNDGQEIDGLRVVDPFRHAPDGFDLVS